MKKALLVGMMFLLPWSVQGASDPECEEFVDKINDGISVTVELKATNLYDPNDSQNLILPLKAFPSISGDPCGRGVWITLRRDFSFTYRSHEYVGALLGGKDYGPHFNWHDLTWSGAFAVHHGVAAAMLKELGFETFEPNGSSFVELSFETFRFSPGEINRDVGVFGIASKGEKLYQIVISQTILML